MRIEANWQDLATYVPLVAAAAASLALLGVIVLLIALRRMAGHEPLSRDALIMTLRAENETLRRGADEQARMGRQELSDNLHKFQTSIGHSFGVLGAHIDGKVREFGGRLGDGLAAMNGRVDGIAHKLDRDIGQMGDEARGGRETLRAAIDGRLNEAAALQDDHARRLREEVAGNIFALSRQTGTTLADMGTQQKERLENTARALRELTDRNEAAHLSLRQGVEGRLDALRGENAAKLEEMRRTVDEKLQSTLETRLGESFTRVVDQLNRVHEGLGEMKSLAANVGDLRSVLTNVKVRGTYGEVQLALILEQFLAPEQYVKDARINPATQERVEFAVKMPGRGSDEEAALLLPIDAKFPRETYERMIEAGKVGDTVAIIRLRKEFETQVKLCAKTIRDKYISPPATTDFAIMFLPTEGLYAEVLQTAGLCDVLQREFRITVAGPTTLAALLTALKVGFRTLAIEKRSSEVWQVLGAVKTEFGKYNMVVDGLAKQLNTALGSVEKLGTRTRAMSRTLRNVHDLPDGGTVDALLKFDSEDEAETPPTPPLRLVGDGGV